MGKGKVRWLKRVREAGEEFDKSRDQEVEETVMGAKADEELFFVDTSAK